MKKTVAIILALVMCLGTVTVYGDNTSADNTLISTIGTTDEVENTSKFSDVSESDWFYTYVTKLADLGMVAGFNDGTFRPYNTITMSEAITIVARSIGIDIENIEDNYKGTGDAVDTKLGTAWCRNQLIWAYDNGIITLDELLNYSKPISRFQVAKIFAVALDIRPDSETTCFLTDTDDYYVTAMYDAGLVAGVKISEANYHYNGNNTITRAEFSTITTRVVEYIESNTENASNNTETHLITNGNTSDYLDMTIKGSKLYITGIVSAQDDIDKIAVKLGSNELNKFEAKTGERFAWVGDLSSIETSTPINVYTKTSDSMFFKSIMYKMIYINKLNGKYLFVYDSTLKTNQTIINELNNNTAVSISSFSADKYSNLVNLTKEITSGCLTDYDKALAIHDWITCNIYFDTEATNYNNVDKIIESKETNVTGFVQLYKAMCNIVNIPCKIIKCTVADTTTRPISVLDLDNTSSNSYINAVKIGDSWILVDTFWDCFNTTSQEGSTKNDYYRTYFDITVEAISQSHRLDSVQ